MTATPLYDDQAERHIAGVATISRHGAWLALDRLKASAFHFPLAWEVVIAGVAIPKMPDNAGIDPIHRRIIAVADRVGMYEAELSQWVAETPCMWDTSGQMAARVMKAADVRRQAQELVAALEALGVPVRWGERVA